MWRSPSFDDCRKSIANGSAAADSGFALRQAIAIENEARRRYTDGASERFTDLIVSGKPLARPED